MLRVVYNTKAQTWRSSALASVLCRVIFNLSSQQTLCSGHVLLFQAHAIPSVWDTLSPTLLAPCNSDACGPDTLLSSVHVLSQWPSNFSGALQSLGGLGEPQIAAGTQA